MILSFSDYLLLFGLTCAIEVPIAMLLLAKVGNHWYEKLLLVLAINLISHPMAVSLIYVGSYLFISYLPMVAFVELLVVLVEWYLYKALFQLKAMRALRISFIVNLVSYLCGSWLMAQ
jgi:hypothetical protein